MNIEQTLFTHGWYQGDFSPEHIGVTEFFGALCEGQPICLGAAILLATNFGIHKYSWLAQRCASTSDRSLSGFNDNPSTSYVDVILMARRFDLFDKGIYIH